MSRNTTTRRTDWKSTLGFRRIKQYDTLADIKNKNISADAILEIPFNDISSHIEDYSKETKLNSEQISALQCLLLQKANYETAKKTAAKSPRDKRNLIMLGLVDTYDINDCKRRLEKRREGKRAAAKEANKITDAVLEQEAYDRLKPMPPAPDGEINISRKGGLRTRTRTSRKTRKSHKRHKKRSTRRRR